MIRRALDLRAALNIGMHIAMDEIQADEFYTMLIIDEERGLLEQEKLSGAAR